MASGKPAVTEALAVLLDVMGPLNGAPSLAEVADVVRRYAACQFDVPSGQDADGLLFQYLEVNWFPEPTFAVSFVRQLDLLDAGGEHEAYLHIILQWLYDPDEELVTMQGSAGWWFPDEGVTLEAWLDSIAASPIASAMAARTPRNFRVFKDWV